LTELKGKVAAAGNLALAVRLGEDLHAIPIESVEEVLPALPIESVPQCPAFVLGVIFVRGHLIPVVSGAERLGIKNHQRPIEPHIVCLRIDDRLVGVEFDEAVDLIDLGSSQPLAAHELGSREGFFVGVVELDGEIVRLLDPRNLIGREEAAALEQVPQTG
jgi:purine-binding chemotaxis protein CheW